jgi:hypothetical protein
MDAAVLHPLPGISDLHNPAALLLHGAYAMPDARNGYTVVYVQQGVITAFDDDTTTVTSPDGFTRTYPLGRLERDTAVLAHGIGLDAGSRVTVMSAKGVHRFLEVAGVSPDHSIGEHIAQLPLTGTLPASARL